MFIQEGKIYWKFLSIAIVLVVIVGARILVYTSEIMQEMVAISNFPEIKLSGNIVKGEIARWPVFKNKEYGFQLRYPKDWNFGPNILRVPKGPHLVFCPPEFSDLESDRGCKWHIQTGGLYNTKSPILLFIEGWNQLKGETKEEKRGVSWCKKEEVKTINAIEMEFFDCDGQKRAYWEDPDGTHLYKFFLSNSEFSIKFYQMLSTFKFLEQRNQ